MTLVKELARWVKGVATSSGKDLRSNEENVSEPVSLIVKQRKEFMLSFFITDFFISSENHDCRFQESSLLQRQIPDALPLSLLSFKKKDPIKRVERIGKKTANSDSTLSAP
ncbi:hypothetical protein J6590_055752 [Homalodisca vitripennis]|nr:hypothetical protein J6590_093943 [Homalodisca vitripennis]KAG8330767.1 hypothetical protein J6590_055752 [Homalodisca vitripennis]